MSERNKITDLGENINNPLHLHRGMGRDAPRPTLLKRRGGKSQGKGEAVHKSDPTDATAEGQGPLHKQTALRRRQPRGGLFPTQERRVRRLDQSGPGGEIVTRGIRRASAPSVRL